MLAVVLGAICLLRARLFTGRAQRGLLLVAGGVALLAVLVAASVAGLRHGRVSWPSQSPRSSSPSSCSRWPSCCPDRRYAPPWSRAADVVESLLVLSVIPLALAVMGVYGAIRLAVS